jgi:hypothetical protein
MSVESDPAIGDPREGGHADEKFAFFGQLHDIFAARKAYLFEQWTGAGATAQAGWVLQLEKQRLANGRAPARCRW